MGDGQRFSALIHPNYVGESLADFKSFTRTSLQVTRPGQWIHCDHGYALTVHRSQGSEWKDVAFVVDWATKKHAQEHPAFMRRLAYTAITRARERVVVFDVS